MINQKLNFRTYFWQKREKPPTEWMKFKNYKTISRIKSLFPIRLFLLMEKKNSYIQNKKY